MWMPIGERKRPATGVVSSGFRVAEPGRREIAGDAAHAEAIGAVWRHLDVDDRVAEPEQLGVACSDRRVLAALR